MGTIQAVLLRFQRLKKNFRIRKVQGARLTQANIDSRPVDWYYKSDSANAAMRRLLERDDREGEE